MLYSSIRYKRKRVSNVKKNLITRITIPVLSLLHDFLQSIPQNSCVTLSIPHLSVSEKWQIVVLRYKFPYNLVNLYVF